jgi:hypothetical protein
MECRDRRLMARRGPRPKPTVVHKIEGTYNPTRHGKGRAQEPQPEADLGAAPLDLTDAETALWDHALGASPKGMLKETDRAAMIVLVEAGARHNEARRMQHLLDTDAQLKLVVRGKSGQLVESPYNRILDKTAKTILNACDRLGFVPTARPRIRLDETGQPVEGKAEDAWSMLRVIRGGK